MQLAPAVCPVRNYIRVKVLIRSDMGTAFVGFDREADVHAAFGFAGADFLGQHLKVSKACDKPVRRVAFLLKREPTVCESFYQCTVKDLRVFLLDAD